MSKLSMRLSFVVAAAALVALTACEPTNANQAQANCAVGTVGGAALGGLLGNQFGGGAGKTALTIAGVAAGGLAGSQQLCR